MTTVIKIATININAITSRTRVGMLTEYIRRHELDIILIQEINTELLNMPGYDMFYNVGTQTRGTAIMARSDIPLTHFSKLPMGRAIAAEYTGLHIVNIYAPSGTARQTEQEQFYNTQLPQLLQDRHGDLIVGGDFNCVRTPADTTGNYNTSRSLAEMIRGVRLTDTWAQNPNRPTHTHFSPAGASRIDRIYVASEVMDRKTGIEILPAAFTAHNALVLRLALGDRRLRIGRARWKINPLLLKDDELITQLRNQWHTWQRRKAWYPNVNIWSDWYVKRQLQQFIQKWEAELNREHKVMEDHLYRCIYDIQQNDMSPTVN
jgi:exonuclease III